jgi:hypothetical protein
MLGAILVSTLFVGLGIGLLAGTVNGGGASGRVLGGVLVLGGLAGGWRFGLHPSVHLTADCVVVTNPLRTVVIPLASIARSTTAGYGGVSIEYFDGKRIRKTTAWAVQKTNVAQVLKRTTRADEVATTIDGAARAAQH